MIPAAKQNGMTALKKKFKNVWLWNYLCFLVSSLISRLKLPRVSNFKKCVLKAEFHDCKYIICIADCCDLKFLQVLPKELLLQQTLVHYCDIHIKSARQMDFLKADVVCWARSSETSSLLLCWFSSLAIEST